MKLTDEPHNIWNVDECGFSSDVGVQKILCRRGSKNPHKITTTNEKLFFTVQGCCSAAGTFLPPYVVYKAKNLYKKCYKNGPESAMQNTSNSGWTEEETFFI